MRYQSIMLDLLECHPNIQATLLDQRLTPAILTEMANHLQASHQFWIQELTRKRPGSAEQIASEALELALDDLKQQFQARRTPSLDSTFSLDDAMAYLRRHTPPA